MSCLFLGRGARGRSRERDISFSTVDRLTDSAIWFHCEFPCLWQYSGCWRERERERERERVHKEKETKWGRTSDNVGAAAVSLTLSRHAPHRTIALDLRWKTGDIYCCFIVTSRSCPYDARWHHHSLFFSSFFIFARTTAKRAPLTVENLLVTLVVFLCSSSSSCACLFSFLFFSLL